MADKTERMDAAAFRERPAKRGRKAAVHVPLVEPVFEQPTTSHGLVFNVLPMGAPRMTRSDKWKKREVVERYHVMKDGIRKRAAELGYELGAVLEIRFELPMPASWSAKKRATMLGQPHQQKPDWDNLAKGFCDAFNVDDSHVHTARVTKVWAEVGRMIVYPIPS